MNTKLDTAQIRVKKLGCYYSGAQRIWSVCQRLLCTASAFMRLLLLLAPQSERGPACRKRLY